MIMVQIVVFSYILDFSVVSSYGFYIHACDSPQMPASQRALVGTSLDPLSNFPQCLQV
ncbi:hypothetical protein K504DRAFT_115323 [Pleomassaria siparia CBS 279.74]|uniref:Uncharacterized protein n=1 Tax=Pleomassaria siparia CBS 279.74 TaxID=1314801 RepID=A0A6G1JW73_9PLEO|nr:hypothetical protein K504DRAFT_115323 [Pleomassaria siparia CBS 279.74]